MSDDFPRDRAAKPQRMNFVDYISILRRVRREGRLEAAAALRR
jgi:hypothetical protein